MRAPDVTGPGKELMTGTPPSPSLLAKLKQSEAEHTQYKERGYQLVGSGPGPSGFLQFRFAELWNSVSCVHSGDRFLGGR